MDAKADRKTGGLTSQDRVSEFLDLLPSLRAKETPKAKPWTKIVGTSPGDEVDDEAARLGSELRHQMNRSRFD